MLDIDAAEYEDFIGLKEKFDTALMINVLEHVPDEGWPCAIFGPPCRPAAERSFLCPNTRQYMAHWMKRFNIANVIHRKIRA